MSPARRRRATTAVVAVAAALVGAAAEWIAYDASDVRWWAPDLAVGWGLVACGLVSSRLAPASRCGPLLCCAGFAWFAGNFAVTDVAIVSWAAEHAAYVHRGFLAHAVLGFPRGRLVSPARRAVVAAVYVAALWPALVASDRAWIVLALAVLAAGVVVGDRRAAPGAVAFALAVGGVAAARLFVREPDPATLTRFYEVGLLATGVVLVVSFARVRSGSALADRVVELGETMTVRDALRRVLGDPSLELAFLRDGGYIDEQGRPLPAPALPSRVVTPLGPTGDVFLIHEASVEVDGGLREAVSRALRLTTENARLQADVLDQLAELRASRRRLVLARGRQRALVARRLRDGAEVHLAEIEAALAEIHTPDGTVARAVVRACRQVEEAREGIAALALGLQPRALAGDGLPGALAALAERSPVPVSLEVEERRLDAAVEHAAYLVCSEALANVAKHAGASHAEVRVAVRDGCLSLEIGDDGRGGADRGGSGLRGLEDRVEELGGVLEVQSVPGRGTRIRAEIPLRTDRDLPESVEAATRERGLAAAVGAGT